MFVKDWNKEVGRDAMERERTREEDGIEWREGGERRAISEGGKVERGGRKTIEAQSEGGGSKTVEGEEGNQ